MAANRAKGQRKSAEHLPIDDSEPEQMDGSRCGAFEPLCSAANIFQSNRFEWTLCFAK